MHGKGSMDPEELDERKDPNAEMTVSISRSSPSPQRDCPSVMTQQSNDSDPSSIERMRLESYIEKIITESPSSESAEDEPSSGQSVERNPFDFSEAKPSFNHIQEADTNDSIKSWLQRITSMQNEIQRKLTTDGTTSQTNSNHSFSEFLTRNISRTSNIQAQSEKIVRYQDLPYMGEMTLDNTKPRRGRKPKKADICHLIYKNYGTIFPGTPDSKNPLDRDSKKKIGPNSGGSDRGTIIPPSSNKSDVQNKIISSLLEKRLTQETKKVSGNVCVGENCFETEDQNEPLNLCIRDMNHLNIRLQRKHSGNTSPSNRSSDVKHELNSDEETEGFLDGIPASLFSDTNSTRLGFPNSMPSYFEADSTKIPENGIGPGGYIYWPNAGVFIHPMALQQHLLYYQRMAANSNYTLPSHSPRPPPDGSPCSDKSLSGFRKIRPKKQEGEEENVFDQKTKRNAPSSDKTPTKRKRSAIFIPPIPPENQNPATEVSIGKFKFTGGAKPTLQEKKMLSVDSGGNFRYYSGTGDKSMRGYEFFPREALQQHIGNAQGSSTGAFLHASGEKIYPISPDCGPKKGPVDFMLNPDLPSSTLSSTGDPTQRQRKRKSRKSLQREKLEQTFKEKGFLIQTQQLESAEGATYCKFRQLRKFTRYLFRSWKDYLPGNVRELQEGEEEGVENDMEDFSSFQVNDNMNSSIN